VLDIEVWNELEDPIEDVSSEIEDAAEEFQFFFTGSAVESPATGANSGAVIAQDYVDSDENGLPLGLKNSVTTLAWGAGELTVTLRHLPPGADETLKVEGLAGEVADGGFEAIGGEDDLQVTFDIEVE